MTIQTNRHNENCRCVRCRNKHRRRLSPKGKRPAPRKPFRANEDEYFIGDLWGSLTGSSGTVDRKSADYIKWVQRSLNKIMRIQLVVDGISGTKTRSAIRDFQRRQGLTVDGDVGEQTEKALIAAGAGKPPKTSTSSSTSRPSSWITSFFSGSSKLRENIVELALKEWERWGRGRIKECDPRVRSILEDYWRAGNNGRVPSTPSWCSGKAWSAVFISWIMREAGAGNRFTYSASHTRYVGEAKKNRLAENSNPFKAYRTSEVAPRVGDLVCKSRDNSGLTYDNVDKGPRASHCDIVVEVRPGKIITIGGNVGNSVTKNTVITDSRGFVRHPRFYAILRVG